MHLLCLHFLEKVFKSILHSNLSFVHGSNDRTNDDIDVSILTNKKARHSSPWSSSACSPLVHLRGEKNGSGVIKKQTNLRVSSKFNENRKGKMSLLCMRERALAHALRRRAQKISLILLVYFIWNSNVCLSSLNVPQANRKKLNETRKNARCVLTLCSSVFVFFSLFSFRCCRCCLLKFTHFYLWVGLWNESISRRTCLSSIPGQ